jgi:hypothetical protein
VPKFEDPTADAAEAKQTLRVSLTPPPWESHAPAWRQESRHHTHFSPHLLATSSHNQPQVPNGEKLQIALRRNGFHN